MRVIHVKKLRWDMRLRMRREEGRRPPIVATTRGVWLSPRSPVLPQSTG
jgi:hypothetical protein